MSERKTILLVDDEEDLSEVLAEILEVKGFSCTLAKEVNEAIELVKTRTFDAIVSDIRMPKLSGEDFIKYLKKEKKMPKVFYFISGFSDIEPEKAIELGADGLFAKPFNVDEIIDALKLKLQ